MTKEESIALAEKLQKNYANLDALKEQIEKNESEIRSRSSQRVKGHSFIRYYWPWIIIAIVLYFLIGFFHNVGFRYAADNVQYGLMNLRGFAPVIALVVGAIVAGVKKGNNQNQVEAAEHSIAETVAKLEKANEDNKAKITRIENELQEYTPLIPRRARTKTAMFKVASMLKTGKAEDFEDALSKLKE